jgi:hypothetical protein
MRRRFARSDGRADTNSADGDANAADSYTASTDIYANPAGSHTSSTDSYAGSTNTDSYTRSSNTGNYTFSTGNCAFSGDYRGLKYRQLCRRSG